MGMNDKEQWQQTLDFKNILLVHNVLGEGEREETGLKRKVELFFAIRSPENKCKRNDKSRKSSFCIPHCISSGRDHWWMLKLLSC